MTTLRDLMLLFLIGKMRRHVLVARSNPLSIKQPHLWSHKHQHQQLQAAYNDRGADNINIKMMNNFDDDHVDTRVNDSNPTIVIQPPLNITSVVVVDITTQYEYWN